MNSIVMRLLNLTEEELEKELPNLDEEESWEFLRAVAFRQKLWDLFNEAVFKFEREHPDKHAGTGNRRTGENFVNLEVIEEFTSLIIPEMVASRTEVVLELRDDEEPEGEDGQ